MRRARLILLLVTLLLLPGCALPGAEETKDEDPLFGLCPQWVQGPGALGGSVVLDATTTTDETRVDLPGSLADGFGGNGTFRGRSLDVYRVTIDNVSGSAVQLRAFTLDGGRQFAIRDYRAESVQMVPVASIAPDAAGKEFDIHLTAVSAAEAPDPQPIRLRWSHDAGEAQVWFTVTFLYRVCGA